MGEGLHLLLEDVQMKGAKVLLTLKRVFKFQERWKEPWWYSCIMILCITYCLVDGLKWLIASF